MADNEALLKELKERWDYCVREWREIREEARKDMRYVSGDPWDSKEKKQRQDAGRPCLSLDELGQYVNQLINDVRQNKRAIKVDPEREDATEKTAELRAGIIRRIQYNSKAQAAYTMGFENMVHRSYGYCKVVKKYVSDDSDDMELAIERVPNPDTIWLDPDAKEADGSDCRYGFEIDLFSESDFKAKWPDADVRSFSSTFMDGAGASNWLKGDRLQVGGYWRKETESKRTRLTLDTPAGLIRPYLDEIPGWKVKGDYATTPEGTDLRIVRRRVVEKKRVRRYDTNGAEILDQTDWEGSTIPIYPFYGKELFVDDGGGSKRILLSLVRLARDPFMLYCYYRTCQAELVGMTPKTPWVGYEGQFAGHEEEWQNVNKVPIPYLQAAAQTEATGSQILPLPQRQLFEPPIQALEMGAEAARRAIQSAIGMGNVSVGKRDPRATSGIALQTLEDQQSQGSYHFIDNYDRTLERIGRDLDEMIPIVYDTESREVGILKPDETQKVEVVNDPNDPESVRTDLGKHSTTISIGPSTKSQREEAGNFLDTLVSNLGTIPVPPPQLAKLLSLAIKMKQLGPTGDEMAEIISPKEQPGQQPDPAAQQAAQQAQQQLQALNEYAKQAEAKAQQLQQQMDAKTADIASREKIAFAELEVKKQEIQAKIGIEEFKAGMNANIEHLWADLEGIKAKLAEQRAVDERAHAADQSQIEREHSAAQSDQDRAFQQEQAQQESEQPAMAGEEQA